MSKVIVTLNISADEYIKLYQGTARSVFARTQEGYSVRFPANILQSFVTHEGINGSFVIEFGEGNKFKDIHRIG